MEIQTSKSKSQGSGLSRREFAAELTRLGIHSGDVVYVRAALGAVGRLNGDFLDTVVGGFLDAVGPQGTIMAPAFTKIGTVFSRTKYIIDRNTVPYSGAISKLFLKHPEAQRSDHPSHSFVAIGPKADELLEGHDREASCFAPVKKLAAMDGKMLLIGCNNDSPGFSTVHVAQFDLGLSQQHLVRWLQRAWIQNGGRTLKWRPNESPGCSASFDKFYPAYIRDENLFSGYVGDAFSLLVPSTKRALDCDMKILKENPRFVDCGRASCLTCGVRSYQLWRLPVTMVAAAWERLLRRA